MNRRYQLPSDCTADVSGAPDSLDIMEDDVALEQYVESERLAFYDEWFRYIAEYE